MRFDQSRRLQAAAAARIPGGCHSYAKAASEYPEQSPGFLVRGHGCHVWDADGNRFIEFSSGNRSVSLGHAYPAVIEAVSQRLADGVNFSRPHPIEVAAAERLCQWLRGAEMVKFCKNGSDATSAAIRLARAITGRTAIAYCADHPFFSSDDWFIGTTQTPAGVPPNSRQLARPFAYNDIDGAARLLANRDQPIAAVILEPAREVEPQDDFLARLRQLCDDHGTLLIFDEMITGFRWHDQGGQAVYGVQPDLACWGKAMANGFSVSALTGRRDALQRGDLAGCDDGVFLLSNTHGAEPHALAAMLATLDEYQRLPVVQTFYQRGQQLADGMNDLVAQHRLQRYLRLVGRPCCLNYVACGADGRPSPALRALFLQETIRGGVLASSLVVNYSHSTDDIDQSLAALDRALAIYAAALRDGVQRYLQGPLPQPIYRR